MKPSIQTDQSVEMTHERAPTSVLGGRWDVGVLGLLLDVKVDIVLLHVQVDRGR